MRANRKIWNGSDGILVLSLLLSALIVWLLYARFSKSDELSADIRLNGEVVMTVPLDAGKVFSLDRLPNVTFEVKDGKIAFVHSDCPDQICVHSGFLSVSGQTAACLPNRVAIRVRGKTPDMVDAAV
ncbi:hypothetical protein FACS1894202_04300 [Clostridia bacterium]|nr:hypothetical protein FACS1894202_04300 [Clostridia bacterium]